MTDPSRRTDAESVIVVGAGVAGCQIARELAADHGVTVLDRNGVAAEASGLAAGVVAPTLFYGDVPALAERANQFFRAFDGTGAFEFTERNRIEFVSDDTDEIADAKETAERLSDLEFPVRYLDRTAIADRHPEFDLEGIAGAVYYEDAGWVDPYTYATALKSAAEDRGASFETGVEVERVVVEDGVITGVEAGEEMRAADAVVVAAGWRTRGLLPNGVELPIRPYRTQCVVIEPDEPLGETFPIGRPPDAHFYFRPEHSGDLLVGGHHDTIEDPTAASGDADESFRLEAAEFVADFLSGFESAGYVDGWAGVDVATPDTRPIVDAPPGSPDGLLVATGFNGLGIMVSPAVGPTVRHRLTGADPGFPTAQFDADRFDEIGTDFEYTSTGDL